MSAYDEIQKWNGKLIELNEEVRKAKEAACSPFKEHLAKLIKEELFDKYDVTKAFWSQYTPYFNDGAACEFSVNGLQIQLSKDEGNEYDEGTYFTDKTVAELKEEIANPKYSWSLESAKTVLELIEKEPEYYKISDAYNKISRVFNSIHDDIFLYAFGDHVIITLTPDGNFDVDGYDHG